MASLLEKYHSQGRSAALLPIWSDCENPAKRKTSVVLGMISNGHLFIPVSLFLCFLLCRVVFPHGLVTDAWGQAGWRAERLLSPFHSSGSGPGNQLTAPSLHGPAAGRGPDMGRAAVPRAQAQAWGREGFGEEQLKSIPIYPTSFPCSVLLSKGTKGRESRVRCQLEHLQAGSAACSVRSARRF